MPYSRCPLPTLTGGLSGSLSTSSLSSSSLSSGRGMAVRTSPHLGGGGAVKGVVVVEVAGAVEVEEQEGSPSSLSLDTAQQGTEANSRGWQQQEASPAPRLRGSRRTAASSTPSATSGSAWKSRKLWTRPSARGDAMRLLDTVLAALVAHNNAPESLGQGIGDCVKWLQSNFGGTRGPFWRKLDDRRKIRNTNMHQAALYE